MGRRERARSAPPARSLSPAPPAAAPTLSILLHHAPAGRAAAEALAARLAEAGLGDAALVETRFAPQATELRLFHAADRAQAEALAEAAGLSKDAIRDFTTFRPSPPEGSVEIRLGAEN